MRTKQLHLLPKEIIPTNASFGGSLRRGKRKIARPLSAKNPVHLVIKSSFARGSLSFVNNRKLLDDRLRRSAKKWGTKIMNHKWNWDHAHLIIHIANRTIYKYWIREFTGAVVQALTKKTGYELKRFFDHRPFTRIIQWGRDLKNAFDYLDLNEMEIFGCRPPRKTKRRSRNLSAGGKLLRS